MNMSRIFLFTTIFFTIFPLIIWKIFHCNNYSYPPSPWTIHKILCHIAGSQQFSHGQAQADTIHPLFVNESGYNHFHCHYQSVSKCLLLSSLSALYMINAPGRFSEISLNANPSCLRALNSSPSLYAIQPHIQEKYKIDVLFPCMKMPLKKILRWHKRLEWMDSLQNH